jgi:hypothetical protein
LGRLLVLRHVSLIIEIFSQNLAAKPTLEFLPEMVGPQMTVQQNKMRWGVLAVVALEWNGLGV